MARALTRDESVALIAEHLGVMPSTPRLRGEALQRVFQRFGWAMLTDEAVAFLADRFEADERHADACAAHNRKLAETRAAERALARAQRETGDLRAEAFPIPSSQKDAA